MNIYTKKAHGRFAKPKYLLIVLLATGCSGVDSGTEADDTELGLTSNQVSSSQSCPDGFVGEQECAGSEPDACTLYCSPLVPPDSCAPKMEYEWSSFSDDGPFILMCFPLPSAQYCPAGKDLHAVCDDVVTGGSDPACWACL